MNKPKKPTAIPRAKAYEVLRKALDESTLSRKDAAALARITPRRLYQVLNGESADTAIDVLRALGYSVTENLECKAPETSMSSFLEKK